MSGGETVLFWCVAPVMVIGALGLIFAKKAVHAALSMALVMVLLGVVYFAQQAPLLATVQIFVYTGAVMMLFLFVLMLVGVDSSDSLIETLKGQRLAATLLGTGLIVLLIAGISSATMPEVQGMNEVNAQGNISAVAYSIFGPFVFAFEITGALLITAALGAMVLAHRERLMPKATQRELSELRIRSGPVKAPLPTPGVFARHNAVDIPALLPDGSPSELSISRVLTARGQVMPTAEHSGDVGEVLHELGEEHEMTSESAVPQEDAAPEVTVSVAAAEDGGKH